MTGPASERDRAQAFLGALDDPIAALAHRYGPVDAYLPTTESGVGTPLEALTLSIIGQQISRAAARAVFARLRDALGGSIAPAGLSSLSEDDLRALGFSYPKARAVRELAGTVIAGELDFASLERLEDDAVLDRLVALRGIGPWSAQVFMLRTLHRPDVFPAGDMGLRRALVRLDDLPDLPSVAAAGERALAWRPYRSYAAKYLWSDYSESGAGPRPVSQPAQPAR